MLFRSMSLMEGAATLTYGTVTAANGVKFDGATYAKGTVLTNASAQLIAQINPSGIDETAIDFAIVNSKADGDNLSCQTVCCLGKGFLSFVIEFQGHLILGCTGVLILNIVQ